MNKPNKFIETLTDAEYHQLLENYQKSADFRVRNRSQAILLSFQKYPVEEIAEICRVHRNTVGIWIDNWKSVGEEGLADSGRSGRPPILTAQEQVRAIETALQNPKFPARQLTEIKQETGKQISPFTLKRLLKKRLSVEEN
jgi:transposase